MDAYSKMDSSAPVSQGPGSVWEIQKKGRIDNQQNEHKKKSKKEEETEFEDGLVTKEEEMTRDTGAEVQKEEDDSDSKDKSPSTARKIDIII